MNTRLAAQALVLAVMMATGPGCGSSEPRNELPMFGSADGVRKLTPEDREFIETMLAETGSREAAANDALARGWSAIRAQDWRLAMRRFNHAWLFAPDSAEVFWGFGVALGLKGDLPGAVRSFEHAAALAPGNAALLCDFGYTFVREAQTQRDEQLRSRSLRKANELLERARQADPGYELTYANLAISAFWSGDYGTAWKRVAEAERLGGKSLDPGFIRDLSARRPRPR